MKVLSTNEYESGKKVYEYRTPGAKNKANRIAPNTEVVDPQVPVDDTENVATVGGDVVKLDNYKDFAGKTAKENPSHGVFDIDAPKPEHKNLFKDKSIWNENLEELFMAIRSQSDFFVQGEAGWAKTALITQMANKCGYTVITVYLDKAVPEDLGGLPALMIDKQSGDPYRVEAPPVWAKYMLDRPNEKFLLFFDEMNQAGNDVMNTLMPIVLKHSICGVKYSNYFCGGAGNMSYENPGLEVIPRPLMSRFGGIITWITGTKEAWQDAFDYLHKVWDSKISRPLVSAFERYCMDFASPRDIEKNIFETVYKFKNSFSDDDDEIDRVNANMLARKIKRQTLTVEGMQKNMPDGNEYKGEIVDHVEELAQKCYDFITQKNSTGKRKFVEDEPDPSENEGDNPTFGKDELDTIMELIERGELPIDAESEVTAPLTHETIYAFFPTMTKEHLSLIDNQLKNNGRSWRYPHNEDAIKTGRWTAEDLEL